LAHLRADGHGIDGWFEVAHEPSNLNGTTSRAIAASPVIEDTPLNRTRMIMMEPKGQDGKTEVEGLETGMTVRASLCASAEQTLTMSE